MIVSITFNIIVFFFENAIIFHPNFMREDTIVLRILRGRLFFASVYAIIYQMSETQTQTRRPILPERAKQMNAVTLAFVGDAVYTLLVRERLALASGENTGELNRRASAIVSAHAQSGSLEKVLPKFTAEEEEIFRRGRNAKKPTKSKNATVGEYVRSTGFEAVIGYLYLTGQDERIRELFFET